MNGIRLFLDWMYDGCPEAATWSIGRKAATAAAIVLIPIVGSIN